MVKTVTPPEPAVQLQNASGVDAVYVAEGATVAGLLNICAAAQRKREAKTLRNTYILLPVSAGIFFVIHWMFSWWYGNKPPSFVPTVLQAVLQTGIFALLNGIQHPAQGQQRDDAKQLAAVAPDDPRTLAALLDTLPSAPVRPFPPVIINWTEYGVLFPALASALWNAGDDLALTLTESRRKRLRGSLYALWLGDGALLSGETDFCAAAIKALTLVGDAGAAKLLKRIATGDALGESRAFVRSIAASALPIHAERAAEMRSASRSLLRHLAPLWGTAKLLSRDQLLPGLNDLERGALLRDFVQKTRGREAFQMALLMMTAVLLALLPVLVIPQNLAALLMVLFVVALPLSVYAGSRSETWPSGVEHAARELCALGDVRSIAPLLDYLQQRQEKSAFGLDELRESLIPLLLRLTEGEGMCLEARHLGFLRHTVRKRFAWGGGVWRIEFVEAAIHALGVAEDERAVPDLETVLRDMSLPNAPFRGAAFDALRCIHEAQARREIASPQTTSGNM